VAVDLSSRADRGAQSRTPYHGVHSFTTTATRTKTHWAGERNVARLTLMNWRLMTLQPANERMIDGSTGDRWTIGPARSWIYITRQCIHEWVGGH